jgi:hypothetical protein
MSVEPMQEIVVEAILNDSYDGAIRLLGDAQRFGFELRSFALTARMDGIASAIITLRVPTSVDAELVATRLSRHPAMQRVNARADIGKALLKGQQAAAA